VSHRYLDVIRREKERKQQGLPPLISIRYEIDNAASDETVDAETGDNESEEETSEDAEDAGTDVESEKRGKYRRQKIIAEVEALRTKQLMTKQEFHTRIARPSGYRKFNFSEVR
jgi:hypothetical protein